MDTQETNGNEIAVIGMAGRFPGARNVREFWENLRAGVESIRFFTEEELEASGIPPALFRAGNYVRANGVLADIEMFDAPFFGFSPREAEVMDPQQRLFLECAWEALEDAGHDPAAAKARVGVYAGTSSSSYFLVNIYPHLDLMELIGGTQAMIANDKDYLSTQVSYKLGLTGPALTVQTACSTSLVAVHLACQSLLDGECDVALAGGASVSVPHVKGYRYQEGGITSPDGHCRAFDTAAGGTVAGNGVGVVVLRRLEDALASGDHIRAVVRGSAINNDGSAKVGFTAPSVKGQAAVITEAQGIAGVSPATVTYVEAHGTGTKLGDPIEMAALIKAFGRGTAAKNYCAVGSVKTNIGHLDAAAGVAGFIKTVLALEHRLLPPSLHFREPNPQIDFADSPFFVNRTLRPWEPGDAPRLAGVSSFGIGGTNAHVILAEAPAAESSAARRPWQLLPLSAKTGPALESAAAQLADYLEAHPHVNLADIAFTLQTGRAALKHRRTILCRGHEDAARSLRTLDPERVGTFVQEFKERPVAFMFPGQGSQYPRMTQGLYESEPAFRADVDECCELLKPHLECDLRELLFPGRDAAAEAEAARRLEQTALTQPALFVVEYALAKLWMRWGVRPQVMIGHSLGEYVAACLAGVFSLQDALGLVARRGALVQQLPAGAMLSVPLPEAEVAPLMAGVNVSVAAVNAPTSVALSGDPEAVAAMERRLAQSGVDCRRLRVSHAFHSHMLMPLVAPFAAEVARLHPRAPQIPFFSNLTGKLITAREATDAGYWGRHLRGTVRFADAAGEMLKNPDLVLLEVGPGQSLGNLVRQSEAFTPARAVLSSARAARTRGDDLAFLLAALGRLWLSGVEPDWAQLHDGERRLRTPLPTYPFERQRYWVEPKQQQARGVAAGQDTQGEASGVGAGADGERHEPEAELPGALHPRPNLPTPYVAPRTESERSIAAIWQELLGIAEIGIHDNFFEVGGHSLMAAQLAARMQEVFPVQVPLREFYETPTVAHLAERVDQMLVELIEGLSEEDAQRLISGTSS